MGAKVLTRFGPSPTGDLHVGGLRTALFNWLYARHAGGGMILRMEDTDAARSRPGFERSIIEDLEWAGLGWDSGPVRQSERGEIYTEYARKLLDSGAAFRCYCTQERLEGLKASLASRGLPPRYDGACRELEKPPAGIEPAIRFRVPDGAVSFTDLVHGPVEFDSSAFGDFVIMGSDGVASYNFACALDDSLMDITHVIRGDDHLPNTPRQLLVLNSLGLGVPAYAHIPLVLGPDRKPLSKRHGHSSVRELREEGYLPIALVNAAARLGWAPVGGEALMTPEELAASFDLERVSKSPSVFDLDRLSSFNREALGRVSAEEVASLLSAPGSPDEALVKAVDAAKGSAATLTELKELIAPLVSPPVMDADARSILSGVEAGEVLKAFRDKAEEVNALDGPGYRELIRRVKEETGMGGRALFMPVRAALTGRTGGIELERIAETLGRDEVLKRIRKALGEAD